MNHEYLHKVLIFLKQEIPMYDDQMCLSDGVFVLKVPDGSPFQAYYEKVFKEISDSIGRIRHPECDFHFSVWSPNQVREFVLLKPE